MKIFIQGRKDGYNTLYPKPTPAEFFQFAADIQRIDAQNNAQYYGKSLYSIAFNGNGCIFTKYIIGYDTLRGNIGNIGVSVFMPNNEKMLGADIKTLLDELINIYTTNYSPAPDFKFNNQKQEDWLLFSSHANNFDVKVKTFSSDENFQYGKKDAAYIFCTNTEIEKYLETPYQEEYKEYKQTLFIETQSQLILEVIKHDQTANLTGKIDLENPSYKLREYHGQGKNGVSIEIRANGKLRYNRDKIFRKDNITIKYSKKYYLDIFEEGKLSDSQIAKHLKTSENSIDVDKNIGLTPIEIPVQIIINNSKGEQINDAAITCNNNYSNIEKQISQNKIVFLGEEQKDKWTISAKNDIFIGEETFTPEQTSIVKLTLREVKKIKLEILDEKGFLITSKSKDLPFYDDDIRKEQSEVINIQGYETQKITFIPKDEFNPIIVRLEKQVYQQPKHQDPQGVSPENGGDNKNLDMDIKKILIVLVIACLLVIGVYFLIGVLWDPKIPEGIDPPRKTNVDSKITTTQIERYVEGDSLFLGKLKNYKKSWEMLKDSIDSNEYKKYSEFIDNAIKKREAITKGDFSFFTDINVKYSENQQAFKNAVNKINQNKFEEVKRKLRDVSKLTLTEIAQRINEILGLPNAENIPKDPEQPAQGQGSGGESSEETTIINYLKGSELKGSVLNEYKLKLGISQKLTNSINLAINFWKLDGERNKSYYSYKTKVLQDKYLKDNSTLKKFVIDASEITKYPKNIPGAGTTLTLTNFINQAQ